MKIVSQTSQNERAIENFTKTEWKIFNEDNGYDWNLEKETFAVIDGDKVLGYIYFKIVGNAGYLSQLIVSKESRRAGIGKILIEFFEKKLAEKGCHVAYLETSEKHTGALKFYKSQGYNKVATLKNNKFGFDWYYLEKKLK